MTLLTLVLLLPLQAAATANGARVDSLMKVEMARRLVPGAAVAVVQNGKIVKTAVYGRASMELDVPASTRTKFQIASATKTVTSVALHRLAAEGNYVVQRLFGPLGMSRAGFGDSRTILAGKTIEYSRLFIKKPAPTLEDLEVHHYEYPDYIPTAAGIFLTVDDAAKWLLALDARRLLDREALAACARPLTLNGKAFHLDESGVASYNLGWVVVDRPVHRALGGSGGARSAYFDYPDDRLGVFLLTNLQGAGPEELAERAAALYLPDLKPMR